MINEAQNEVHLTSKVEDPKWSYYKLEVETKEFADFPNFIMRCDYHNRMI